MVVARESILCDHFVTPIAEEQSNGLVVVFATQRVVYHVDVEVEYPIYLGLKAVALSSMTT